MNFITRYRLWTISRRATPDADFVARLASRFTPRRAMNFAMRMSAATTALVLSLGLGTSAYAYTSDDVTPDSPLYAVRTTLEDVEEAVARTPARKQAVQLKLIQRRLHEIQVIEERAPRLKEKVETKLLERVEGALKEDLRPSQRQRLEGIKTRLQNKLPKR